MEKRFAFKVASYAHAEYLSAAGIDEISRGIDFFEKYCPLDKIYLEMHRGTANVPAGKMGEIKALFARRGIEIAGGLTPTIRFEGQKQKTVFDVFCYTDPEHRRRFLEIIKESAAEFDEILLDDLFFASCRCPQCIEAKGDKSWRDFRRDQMADISRLMTEAAREVNPRRRLVIKYPNWPETFQDCGYDPLAQKEIVWGIYTGTESRDPKYHQQHLQRYHSYAMIRIMENAAPGRNQGGWIDITNSSDDISALVQQGEFTLFAKSPELLAFHFAGFGGFVDTPFLPPLGQQLPRVDGILRQLGNPRGASFYMPFGEGGEDTLVCYLGMIGLALEPTPFFKEDADPLFLAEGAANDPEIIPKLKKFLLKGGTVIITAGFLKRTTGRGIEDLVALRSTGRHVSGSEFGLDTRYSLPKSFFAGTGQVGFEVIEYKINTTWVNLAMETENCNFPVIFCDNYGRGTLYTLNVPDNFGDLYKLPREASGYLSRLCSGSYPVYIKGGGKCCLFTYDNETFGVYNLKPHREDIEIVIKGEEYTAIVDLETGSEYRLISRGPPPAKLFGPPDASADKPEKSVPVSFFAGTYHFFKLIR
jgi:hypothetical protein